MLNGLLNIGACTRTYQTNIDTIKYV